MLVTHNNKDIIQIQRPLIQFNTNNQAMLQMDNTCQLWIIIMEHLNNHQVAVQEVHWHKMLYFWEAVHWQALPVLNYSELSTNQVNRIGKCAFSVSIKSRSKSNDPTCIKLFSFFCVRIFVINYALNFIFAAEETKTIIIHDNATPIPSQPPNQVNPAPVAPGIVGNFCGFFSFF